MSPRSDRCSQVGHRRPVTRFSVSPSSFSDLPNTKSMCHIYASRRNDSMYKRKNLGKNTITLLLEESTSRGASCDIERASVVSSSAPMKEFHGSQTLVDSGKSHQEVPFMAANSQIEQIANNGENNVSNDRRSSPKANAELRSSVVEKVDSKTKEPFEGFASTRELCIHVLKSSGLLPEERARENCDSIDDQCEIDSEKSLKCIKCGVSECSSKMLICDLCEEAFHLSCCNRRGKKLPVDEWYCQVCFRKKPKHLRAKLLKPKDELDGNRNQVSRRGLRPIALMLKDTQPYTTGVRIGKDFQVEVLEWNGLIADTHDCLGEPSEDLKSDSKVKSGMINNWIQCREKIVSSETDKEMVCGKWRRAPLFAVQTDDWDCSCAIPWDPTHADCELETDEVLKQLKYIKKLRCRLSNKKKKSNQI
ncbi:hypothetical protein ACMD2_15270 [Ananas comosus]|uniref:PHD-type domain-containing protein n=1 Tax=Ananas comosus TaxID=4615 RepID=A0A199VAJ2_ANACO|nr:hypothetical protein ACMD2_15270 [Ananas comosus]